MKQGSVAVVGGGAAGIAAAYYLRREGFAVELIESGPVLGGRMATASLGPRRIALGGKNIGRRYELFRAFVRDMGDQPFEYFGLNSSRIRNGRIVTFDGERRWSGLARLLKSSTPRDILRLAPMVAAVKRERSNAFLGGAFFRDLAVRHRNSNLASHFSEKFCHEFVRPLSVRMNGAEADEVTLGNFGTNLCMVFDTYEQLSDGLDPVFEAFSRTGPVRLGTAVEALRVEAGRVVGVRIRDASGARDLDYDGVVFATPACVSARLLAPHLPRLASLLDAVRYYPVAVVVAEYARPIFGRDMRALVFPRDHALSNAGVYGIEQREIIRYTFSGAAARELLADTPDVERLLELGERTLGRYIPLSSEERRSFVGKIMPIGLCAYAADHARFAADAASEIQRLSGLELAGDYLHGASIEGCFRAGRACADRFVRRGP